MTEPSSADRANPRALWLGYLVLGVLVICGHLLLPLAGVREVILPLVAASAAVAIVVGARMNRPSRPLVWYLLVGWLLMFATGDAFFLVYENVLRIDPFRSAADASYLGAYPFYIVGLLLLIRGRTPGGDKASLVDATIITTSLGLLSWTFLMAPYAQDPTLSPLERSISMAYPLADVLLLGVAMRLVVAPGARTIAFLASWSSACSPWRLRTWHTPGRRWRAPTGSAAR